MMVTNIMEIQVCKNSILSVFRLQYCLAYYIGIQGIFTDSGTALVGRCTIVTKPHYLWCRMVLHSRFHYNHRCSGCIFLHSGLHSDTPSGDIHSALCSQSSLLYFHWPCLLDLVSHRSFEVLGDIQCKVSSCSLLNLVNVVKSKVGAMLMIMKSHPLTHVQPLLLMQVKVSIMSS